MQASAHSQISAEISLCRGFVLHLPTITQYNELILAKILLVSGGTVGRAMFFLVVVLPGEALYAEGNDSDVIQYQECNHR